MSNIITETITIIYNKEALENELVCVDYDLTLPQDILSDEERNKLVERKNFIEEKLRLFNG